MANIQLYYTEPIHNTVRKQKEIEKDSKLVKQWLKKNKPKYYINSREVSEREYRAKKTFYSCPTVNQEHRS